MGGEAEIEGDPGEGKLMTGAAVLNMAAINGAPLHLLQFSDELGANNRDDPVFHG